MENTVDHCIGTEDTVVEWCENKKDLLTANFHKPSKYYEKIPLVECITLLVMEQWLHKSQFVSSSTWFNFTHNHNKNLHFTAAVKQ